MCRETKPDSQELKGQEQRDEEVGGRPREERLSEGQAPGTGGSAGRRGQREKQGCRGQAAAWGAEPPHPCPVPGSGT